MCGILFSQNSNNFLDLEMLKRRGPEGFTEQTNSLGYFAHSMLNTIGENTPQPYQTKNGVLLYNGSTYNSGLENDTKWIGNRLDDNVGNTVDVVKELNGEYALIHVTDKNVVFCVDHFDNRNLWFYHDQDTRELTIASVPNIVQQKHGKSWRAEGNKIYIMDRHDFSIKVETNKVFNLDQKTNHFDHVFEKFEQAVRSRYNPLNSIALLSSGFDSGVINCGIQKMFNEVDCVSDPAGEIIPTLKERTKLHKAVILPNHQGHHEEKEKMFHDILPRNELWDDPTVDPLINIMKNYVVRRKKKIVLFGQGGDEVYNDWHEQTMGFKWTRTNGSFPSSLEFVWPWYNHNRQLHLCNTRTDLITGYFGLEARNPLLDIDLVQAWLNTTCELKNNGNKSWMKAYMDQENYPYATKKAHWCNQQATDYKPDLWKLTKKK